MDNLKTIRKERGFTRKFVAAKLEICPDHLNHIERGKTRAKIDYIKKLSEIYNLSFSKMSEIALATYEGRNNL
jgi:transcriptional regulator with XRE-family HTH domain